MYNEYSAVVFAQMLIIAALVIKQRGEARKLVAFLFAVLILAHNFVFGYLHTLDNALAWYVNDNPFVYHFSAALVSVIIIRKIAGMTNPPELATDIQYISVAAIALNLIGWWMSRFGVPNEALINNILFIVLYLVAIIFLFIGEPKHDAKHRVDTRLFTVHSGDVSRHIIHSNH